MGYCAVLTGKQLLLSQSGQSLGRKLKEVSAQYKVKRISIELRYLCIQQIRVYGKSNKVLYLTYKTL
jgi:hypothetical protein